MENSKPKLASSLRVATIDIDGILGTPEAEQFERPEGHVATYERFAEALEQIRAEGLPDRLVVNIRSTGGCLADALLIYEAICGLGIEVVTRCYGYVASAATIVAQAASKGSREISANALYLIHCCESTVEGNTHSLDATRELLEKSDAQLAEIYSLASGRPVDHFRELMNRNSGNGVWLSPEEALEAGLVDSIIASSPIAEEVRNQVGQLGLPPLPAATSATAPRRGVWNKLLRFVGLSYAAPTTALPTASGESVAPSKADSPDVGAPPTPPSRLHTAEPTAVKECEDPAPTGTTALSSNEQAYAADVMGLREAMMRS